MTVSMLLLYQKFQTLSKLSMLIVICTKWNYYNSSNIEFKQINSLLQWFQTLVLQKDTLTFLRPILYSQKNPKLYVKLISFCLKYDSYYVNIFIKIQVTVAWKDQTDQQFITMISDISSARRHSHFFKTHFIFTKNPKLYVKLISFSLKYDSYYVNIFIKIQVTVTSKVCYS